SLATVTPSLVTVGEPNDFWMITLRPLGPSVTLTARANFETPRRIASRASWSNAICLALMLTPCWSLRHNGKWFGGLPLDDGQYVFLVHDEDGVAGAALLELVAGPGGEQDGVPFFDLERPPAPVLEHPAGADGEYGAALRLLLGVVWQDDAAAGL